MRHKNTYQSRSAHVVGMSQVLIDSHVKINICISVTDSTSWMLDIASFGSIEN